MKTPSIFLSSLLMVICSLQVSSETNISNKFVPLMLNKVQVQLAEIKLKEKSGVVEEIRLEGKAASQKMIKSIWIETRNGEKTFAKMLGKQWVINTNIVIKGQGTLYLKGELKNNIAITDQIHLSLLSLKYRGQEAEKIQQDISLRAGVAVRSKKQDGVHTYRIPGLSRAKDGTLLAIYDIRRTGGRDLQGHMDIGLSRSTDGGQNWLPMQVVLDMGEFGGLPQDLNGVSDACVLVDENSGRIFVAGTWMWGDFREIRGKKGWLHQWHGGTPGPGFSEKETCQYLLAHSDDNGKTWSKPYNITKQVKKKEEKLFCPAPGRGITLKDGTLAIPSQGRDKTGKNFSCFIYSKDSGKTWLRSASQALQTPRGTTECSLIQLADESLMLNMRDNRNGNNGPGRTVAVTKDMGKTWQEHSSSNNNTLPSPRCMASLHRHVWKEDGKEKSILLFSNPATKKGRYNTTIKVSFDQGKTWPASHHFLLDSGNSAGYSCITSIDENNVGILYEGSQAHMSFQRLSLKELLKGNKK